MATYFKVGPIVNYSETTRCSNKKSYIADILLHVETVIEPNMSN